MTSAEEPVSPLSRWQWAELWALALALGVQVWLYRVSVVAGAAWGLVVLVLVGHLVIWVPPLLRERQDHGPEGR